MKHRSIRWKIFLSLIALGYFTSGCIKGPFEYVSVVSTAIIDDQFYVLFIRQAGINKASVGSDGNGLHISDQSITLARCNLSNDHPGKLEVVGSGIFNPNLYDGELFEICSTNTIIAPCTSGVNEVYLLNFTNKPLYKQSFIANKLIFSCNHDYAFTSGNPAQLLTTATMTEQKKYPAKLIPAYLSASVKTERDFEPLAMADDPRVFAYETTEPSTWSMNIKDFRPPGFAASFTESYTNEFELKAISADYVPPRILCSERHIVGPLSMTNNNDFPYVIMDSAGHVLDRFFGRYLQFAASHDLSKIVFYDSPSTSGKSFPIRFWSQQAIYSGDYNLDLKEVFANLGMK